MQAFVNAMKPRSKSRVWENEGDGLQEANTVVKQEAVRSKKTGGEDVLLTRTHVKFDNSDTSSDEDYDDAPAGRTVRMSLFMLCANEKEREREKESL